MEKTIIDILFQIVQMLSKPLQVCLVNQPSATVLLANIPPVQPQKKRKRYTDQQFHAAIKQVIDENTTLKAAAEASGLYRSALSNGRGKKILEDAMSAVSALKQRKVSEAEGNDYLFNEIR